jgi:DNA topoisomerase-6 subunit B
MTEDFGPVVIFPRGVESLPPETKEIQPHPKGVELGILLQMMKDFEATERTGTLYGFLQEKFSRVSAPTASEFCQKIGVTSRTKVADIEPRQAEALYQAFMEAKLPPPPTDCLAPIGVRQLLSGMLKGVRAEFYAASTREAEVYRGRPFLIEAAVAFGGELPAQEPARVIRFANRVPLLYQQSACSSFKAVTDTNWRNYDLDQPRGSVPTGPLVVMLHMASVWVPFTSESKEAIADYEEIRKEMKLALMECGRKLGAYLKKRARMRREGERRDVFQKYIGEIAKAVNAINGTDAKRLYDALLQQAMNRTAVADQVLDEDGRVVDEGDPGDQDGVIIIEANKPQPPQGPGGQGGSRGAPASGGASGGGGTTVGATRAAPSAKVAKAAKGSGGAKGARSSANPDRSAAAHLAVAAMAKDDDDQPTLLPRERAGPAAPKAAQPAPAPVTTPSSSPASPMADKAAARAAKPTLRVDPATGKLTPAPKTGRGRDDGAAGQGLFGR